MPGQIPLNDDLKELIKLFQSHEVEFLVVGAHALAFHARPRFTEDLDLFLRRTDENIKRTRTPCQTPSYSDGSVLLGRMLYLMARRKFSISGPIRPTFM